MARVWYARSHGGKKLGKKVGGMRRMMNCGGGQAGRGAQVRTGHRRVWPLNRGSFEVRPGLMLLPSRCVIMTSTSSMQKKKLKCAYEYVEVFGRMIY